MLGVRTYVHMAEFVRSSTLDTILRLCVTRNMVRTSKQQLSNSTTTILYKCMHVLMHANNFVNCPGTNQLFWLWSKNLFDVIVHLQSLREKTKRKKGV